MAATPRSAGTGPRPIFYRVLAGALVAALAGLGVPQTARSLWRAHAEAGVDPFHLETPADESAALAAYPVLESLDERLGDPGARILAGRLRLDLPASGEGLSVRDAAAAAAGDLETGLARQPANDIGWYELAQARFRLDDLAGARDALRASMLLGFFDPALNLARADLGLRLWLVLDPSDLRLLQDQVRFAWVSHPQGLLGLARGGAWQRDVIRHALDEEALAGFDAALSPR